MVLFPWTRRLAAAMLMAWLWAAPAAARPPLHAQTAPAAPPRTSVVIQLDAPSVVEVYAAQQVAGDGGAATLAALTQTHLATLHAEQAAFLAELAAYDVQLLYQVQRVYNGVAVRLPVSAVAAVEALPGVRGLYPLIPKTPANSRAVPRIGAVEAWQAAPGLTGRGVTIALIDTGLDYLHTTFGGPGSGYPVNDRTRIGDLPNFPGVKVIGGYDFAGDDYDADAESSDYQPIPHPDPDPMDCYSFGHGTHVGGSAAGYGVTAAGTTYRGEYPPADDADLRIGPGVAPHAQIYALKVFGCGGSSELVDQALEWAVDPNGDGDFADHADVINLSLGSPFGAPDDITALAAANAAKTGALVVASAGNSSDLFYAVSSPGTADAVLTVAASSLPPLGLAETVKEFSSRGPVRGNQILKPDLVAPGDNIVSARAGSGSGAVTSSGTSMATGIASGALALLRQAHPGAATTGRSWTAAELKALAMNTALPLTNPEGERYGPTRAGVGRLDLHRALTSQVVAYDAGAPARVAVHFGAPDVFDFYEAVARVEVANKGPTPITMTVGYTDATALPGALFSVAAGKVLTVPAGGTASVPVRLAVSAAALRHLPDPTLSHNSLAARSWLAEVSGYVVLTPAEPHPALRVPVYAAPRPVAQLQMTPAGLEFGSSLHASTWLTYTGQGLAAEISAGFPPTLPVALGGVFALHQRSLPLITAPDGAPGLGRYAQADLAAVGMALNAAQDDRPEMLVFAIAVYAPWSTPHEVDFLVNFDVDLDGASDLQLANSDQVAWYGMGNGASDAFAGALLNLHDGGVALQPPLNTYPANVYDTRLFNSRVMLLPVRTGDLNLPDTARRFAYYVESYSEDIANARPLGIVVDRTPWIEVDLDAPGLAVAPDGVSASLRAIQPGDEVQLEYDAAGLRRNPGLLVVYLHNAPSRQVEVIPAGRHVRAYFPWLPSPQPAYPGTR